MKRAYEYIRRSQNTTSKELIGGFSGLMVDGLQASASTKFGGYAIFFVYTALLGLPALVLAVIVRRHFEKETPPSARKEGQ
jgi:PAT family beta-lactamase induction signal transducer AmpG